MRAEIGVRTAWLLLALAAVLVACSGPPDAGAEDTDGDGESDRAVVGDWNGDGKFETADVQAAIDALEDEGPKTITLMPGIEFRPVEISSLVQR